MITLTCTHCQTLLSIDDAFAGGVCRCQHCGTIQTVPSHLKNAAAVGAGVAEESKGSKTAAKTLYQSQRPADANLAGSGTGLEDLAQVVASSGLSSSGLASAAARRSAPARKSSRRVEPPPVKASRWPLLVIGGTLVAIAAGVVWWVMSGPTSGQRPPVASGTESANTSVEAPAIAGPQFCDVPLAGNSVIYVLDRGDSAKDVFDYFREATYRSIQSLGPDRKFQVLLWDNKTGDERFPGGPPTFATKDNLDACRRTFEDVVAYRQSDIKAPLARAVGESPDAIVIVTAKGLQLDESFLTEAEAIRKNSTAKIYAISVRSDCDVLKTLAQRSGGMYKMLSDGALKAAVSQ